MLLSEEQLIKNKISKRFNFVANTYLQKCKLQTQVSKQLITYLHNLKIQPKCILDLGAGAGNSVNDLKKLFPNAELFLVDIAENMLINAKNRSEKTFNICADFDNLPFPQETFDLIFANLSLQWSLNFEYSLLKIKSILKKKGILAFSILGNQSLNNIKQAWSNVDQEPHINDFINFEKMVSIVEGHFSHNKIFSEDIFLSYPDMRTMIHSFKEVGANYVINKKTVGLTGRNKFSQFSQNLAKLQNHIWSAQYEIFYCLTA